MGSAPQRRLQIEPAPTSRAPSSGVRPRVRPEAPANDTAEPVTFASVIEPARVVAAPAAQPVFVFEDGHALEDAVPLRGDAALAAVLGLVVATAGGLVAAFNLL